MIDVIHHADVLAQLEQVLDSRNEVRRIQRAIVQRRVQPHLDVELQAADPAEIEFARIEEHSPEKILCRLESRRISRTQLAVDLHQRFLRKAEAVLLPLARET